MKDIQDVIVAMIVSFLIGFAIGFIIMVYARDGYWEREAVAHGAATYVQSKGGVEFRWNDALEVGP